MLLSDTGLDDRQKITRQVPRQSEDVNLNLFEALLRGMRLFRLQLLDHIFRVTVCCYHSLGLGWVALVAFNACQMAGKRGRSDIVLESKKKEQRMADPFVPRNEHSG